MSSDKYYSQETLSLFILLGAEQMQKDLKIFDIFTPSFLLYFINYIIDFSILAKLIK